MNDRPQDQTSFTSQTGHDTDGASAEYRDGLTVQGNADATSLDTERDRTLGNNTDGFGRDQTAMVRGEGNHKLISADRVQGTAVYDAAGERIGTVDSIMINKLSGEVAYAVLGIGGFLGIGERYAPLPWDELSYDTTLDGYRTRRGGEAFREAPNYSREETDSYDYDSRSGEIDDYYAGEATQSSTMPSSGMGSTGRTLG